MMDILEKQQPTPIAVQSDTTDSVWEAAKARQARARETVSRCIDNRIGSSGNGPVLVQPVESTFSVVANSSADPITTMNLRGLLLADALQRHALLKIAETGVILDEIDRAVAGTTNENFYQE